MSSAFMKALLHKFEKYWFFSLYCIETGSETLITSYARFSIVMFDKFVIMFAYVSRYLSEEYY